MIRAPKAQNHHPGVMHGKSEIPIDPAILESQEALLHEQGIAGSGEVQKQETRTCWKMPRYLYTEDSVVDAILDITDNGLSQHQAAQKHGIPQSTLSTRLNGQGARNDQIQPGSLLSKNQERQLVQWILRQESIGYAPSHSQVRACVLGLLEQQGVQNPDLGKNWVARFLGRYPEVKTKPGRRQEAARFDSFTPRAVKWYFDIREDQYSWIKPENTVNIDKGGIMAGFGLDSLVIGSSDPKRKAFLKGPQSRNWTSFIEAKQWFLEDFRKIADWYYITSTNGWTDNHIAIEWLREVYLPQTEPLDPSDARLIILDGHGSHASPLDNGPFNSVKATYRKELEKLALLTDSTPVDKVNFIRAYSKAREIGLTRKNILSGWRVTGNWPISRAKALRHPEIQPDKERAETPQPQDRETDSDRTPKTSRQIRDMGKSRSPSTRRKYALIAKGFEAQEIALAEKDSEIERLKEELDRLKRGRKRKAVPNPNRRFMQVGEALAAGEPIPPLREESQDEEGEEDEVLGEVVEGEDKAEELLADQIGACFHDDDGNSTSVVEYAHLERCREPSDPAHRKPLGELESQLYTGPLARWDRWITRNLLQPHPSGRQLRRRNT
ncbi:hypothetical protein MKZ38_003963 [Zalerion maritima]|uniref:HTH CENPB-type domain-containing protein n=1 Tax=Zalerion maritima TaxID=339359 RepID=A0AAD5WPW4_9PEZI|nr:hypothetical protein MKZ38_003963 [Zalerion maritima]